jgi:hypothetical protein
MVLLNGSRKIKLNNLILIMNNTNKNETKRDKYDEKRTHGDIVESSDMG